MFSDPTASMSIAEGPTVTSSSVADPAPFKCAQCLISFGTNALQREHMHSEWHLYNLKRRIAAFAPLSLPLFEEQVLSLSQQGIDEKNAQPDNISHVCRKSYDTSRQYKNHLKGQHHIRNASNEDSSSDAPRRDQGYATNEEKLSGGSSTEEEDPDEDTDAGEADFNASECLFCNKESPSLDENMGHMHKAHGLFIPDQDHLIDLESLLSYLSVLIFEFHEWLYCGAIKDSPEGVQHHMTDKGHCKINIDRASNLADFYDYPESDSEASKAVQESKDGEPILRLSSGSAHSHRLTARHQQRHASSTPDTTSTSQQLLTEAPSTSAARSQAHSSTSRALTPRSSDARALIGVSDVQKRSLRAVEKKMLKMEVRARNEYQRKVERAGNKQKHFRNDVPGPTTG